ncbi:hypothetical protein [Emticicia sp. BO119]|uniref:hypothetical protein n=1 Tax=Emticicia sp. BO119 TaxID=2757768 RepID=UPI0015F1166F|nr:hypothetical protein [Emticicia sp. BO119]MBA4848982.1 hypothetical protein [Emticicia sp. BO119]
MIMICFSTEQNTTNLIPAIQIAEVKEVVIIESAIAENKKWADGMIRVLQKRGKKTDKINLKVGDGKGGEDTQILSVLEKINVYIQTKTKPHDTIYWNTGGGLKPLILAMYQAYLQRNNPEDKICYSNPFNAKPSIDFFQNVNGIQNSSSINIGVDLTAHEIIQTYGLKIKSARLFYNKHNLVTSYPFADYFKFKEFRNYAFGLSQSGSNDLSEEFTLNDLANIFSDPQKSSFFEESLTDSLKKYFGSVSISKKEIISAYDNTRAYIDVKHQHFFEANKINLFVDYLRALFIKTKDKFSDSLFAKTINHKSEKPCIDITNAELASKLNTKSICLDNTLLRNLGFSGAGSYFEGILEKRVYQFLKSGNHKIIEAYSNVKVIRENHEEIAQYDVLLVTNHGTVIALEAKTFDFEQKDIDARQFNLEKASSRIVEMYVVLPYDPEDFNEPYFSKNLEDLPFRLKERNIKFFVIADSVQDKSFQVDRTDNKLMEAKDKGIQINKLECLFDKLCLI